MFAQTLRINRLFLNRMPLRTTITLPAINNLIVGRRSYSDEVVKAQAAAKSRSKVAHTIFDKIIAKEIPATIIYEDAQCLAFQDVAPQAPVHFLVIPKTDVIDMLENSNSQNEQTLGHLLTVAGKLGKERAPNGFRVVVNNGPEGCQSVYHLHLHVLGGRQLNWPPG